MVGFMKSALNLLGIKKEGESSSVGLDEFLQALPELLGYDIRFKKEERDGRPHYELEGSEVESLLAENPNLLEAFSHISMRIIRKGEGASNTPPVEGETGVNAFYVSFDAGGFKERKTLELKELAATQRQKVLDNGGKPAYISALSPGERKVIHTHLLELGDVMSESIGKGNFKRIRVRLKDDSPLKRQRPAGGGGERSQSNGDRGPRRGPRRNGGQGQGGRQEFGGGRGNRAPANSGFEPNGNRVAKDEDTIDDNIGNRLAPGEESPFFSSSFGSSDTNDRKS
jgi:spoIIIJ-associated protein